MINFATNIFLAGLFRSLTLRVFIWMATLDLTDVLSSSKVRTIISQMCAFADNQNVCRRQVQFGAMGVSDPAGVASGE